MEAHDAARCALPGPPPGPAAGPVRGPHPDHGLRWRRGTRRHRQRGSVRHAGALRHGYPAGQPDHGPAPGHRGGNGARRPGPAQPGDRDAGPDAGPHRGGRRGDLRVGGRQADLLQPAARLRGRRVLGGGQRRAAGADHQRQPARDQPGRHRPGPRPPARAGRWMPGTVRRPVDAVQPGDPDARHGRRARLPDAARRPVQRAARAHLAPVVVGGRLPAGGVHRGHPGQRGLADRAAGHRDRAGLPGRHRRHRGACHRPDGRAQLLAGGRVHAGRRAVRQPRLLCRRAGPQRLQADVGSDHVRGPAAPGRHRVSRPRAHQPGGEPVRDVAALPGRDRAVRVVPGGPAAPAGWRPDRRRLAASGPPRPAGRRCARCGGRGGPPGPAPRCGPASGPPPRPS